jgi:DNA-binding SARP family transcriptional activator
MEQGQTAAVRVLREFAVVCDARSIVLSQQCARLVGFLAIEARRCSRAYVAERLWPGSFGARCEANLRTVIWRLANATPGSLLVADRHGLQLHSAVEVDVQRARQAMHEDADDPAIFAWDLLPDWYDDWLIFERERYRQERLHALESIARRATTAGDYARAVEASFLAIASDPLRESAHRVAIEVHLAEGNVVEAHRQADRYLEILADAGLEPTLSPVLERLIPSFKGARRTRTRS